MYLKRKNIDNNNNENFKNQRYMHSTESSR